MVIIVAGGGIPSSPTGSEERPPTKPSSPAPLSDREASLLQCPHAFAIAHKCCGDGVVVLGPASTMERCALLGQCLVCGGILGGVLHEAGGAGA